jgi:hypothetical protein
MNPEFYVTMGCCLSKSNKSENLDDPILKIDEVHLHEEPIFSWQEYYILVKTAKQLRKKYNPN